MIIRRFISKITASCRGFRGGRSCRGGRGGRGCKGCKGCKGSKFNVQRKKGTGEI
jgi:hypothetical protein